MTYGCHACVVKVPTAAVHEAFHEVAAAQGEEVIKQVPRLVYQPELREVFKEQVPREEALVEVRSSRLSPSSVVTLVERLVEVPQLT